LIFVSVGNHYLGFDRLVKKMDEIAGEINEKVIMQIGCSRYKPFNAEYFDFIDNFEEILRLNREARVVVSHAGAGSIITALNQETPIIIVPRLKVFKEHLDDHQLEIANAFSNNKNVRVVHNVESLNLYINTDFKYIGDNCSESLVIRLKSFLSSR